MRRHQTHDESFDKSRLVHQIQELDTGTGERIDPSLAPELDDTFFQFHRRLEPDIDGIEAELQFG